MPEGKAPPAPPIRQAAVHASASEAVHAAAVDDSTTGLTVAIDNVNPLASRPRTSAAAALETSIEALLGAAILIELLLLFGNTMARLIAHHDYVWTAEAARFPLAVMMWIGAPFALRRGLYVSVRVFLDRVPERLRIGCEQAARWFVVGTAVGLLAVLTEAMRKSSGVKTPILGIPEMVYLIPAPIGVLLLIGFTVGSFGRTNLKMTLAIGAVMAVLAIAIVWALPPWFTDTSPQVILFGLSLLTVVLLLFGVPIAFVMIGIPLLFLALTGIAPASTVVLRIQDATQQVVLVTIPFFILAGALMATGGLAERLSEMIASLVGHFRGGLYYVLVIFMFFFSGLSGSKAADMAAVGRTMAVSLARGKYLSGESAACLAASGAMYETVPPSVTLLVVSSVTGLSIATLFLAGVMPAVVLAAATMLWIFIRRSRYAVVVIPPASWGTRARAMLRSVPALILPIILVGGIITGIGDPIEVSSFAVVYALLAGLVFERKSMSNEFWRSLGEGSALTGMILLLVAAASAFSWILTVSQFPQQLAEGLQRLSSVPVVFVIASVLALVVMGAILEGLPAVVIFVPMLIPIATALGINPLHYAIVLVLAMGLGFFLPIVGVGSYMACGIVRTDVKSITRPLIGYAGVILVVVLAIAFVPGISLELPKLVTGR